MKVENLSYSITNLYLGVMFSGAKKIFFAEKEGNANAALTAFARRNSTPHPYA
jgi:hypothetical protein